MNAQETIEGLISRLGEGLENAGKGAVDGSDAIPLYAAEIGLDPDLLIANTKLVTDSAGNIALQALTQLAVSRMLGDTEAAKRADQDGGTAIMRAVQYAATKSFLLGYLHGMDTATKGPER